MKAHLAMLAVSIFACFGALFLALTLRRYHRENPVARRIAWLPVCIGLQSLNLAVSFLWDSNMEQAPFGVVARSVGGWLFIGLALWYLGFYFAGKVNGKNNRTNIVTNFRA